YDDDGFEKVPTSYPVIQCLMEDSEGNVWVGTDGGGLNQIRPRAAELETVETGLPFSAVESLAEYTNGTVWVTTRNGALAHRTTNGWTTIPSTDIWNSDATCITVDQAANLWIGTRQHGLLCLRTNGWASDVPKITGTTVHTLLATRSGD